MALSRLVPSQGRKIAASQKEKKRTNASLLSASCLIRIASIRNATCSLSARTRKISSRSASFSLCAARTLLRRACRLSSAIVLKKKTH